MAKVKHIVLLKFKVGTTQEQIDGIFRDLEGLQDKISGIEDFLGGPYSSDEGLNQGFTHGFVMTVTDAAARDAYLAHPEHQEVKNAIIPHADQIVAFDFEV